MFKRLFAITLFLAVSVNAWGATSRFDTIIANTITAKTVNGEEVSSKYASLNAAIAAISTTPTTLLISSANFPMTGAAVVPATLQIKMEYPGSIAGATYALTTNGSLTVGPHCTINTSGAININGSKNFPLTQVFTGSGTVKFPINAEVDAEWWGSGAAAMQKAIDSGYVSGSFNPGYITVNLSTPQTWASAIDLTTRNFVHIKFRPGTIVTSTSTDYVFDATSLGYSTLENVNVESTTAKVGYYVNRGTTRQSAEFNRLINCSISLASSPTANSNTGTIGLYNSRSELFTVNNSQFYADVPVILENTTRSYLLPIYETMQVTGAGWDSTTIIKFDSCMFSAAGTYAPAMYTNDVLGLECLNSYWRHRGVSSGSNTYAIVTNNMYRSRFTGSVETWPQFLHSLRVANQLYIDIAIQGENLNTSGIINVDSVSSDVGGIQGSDISILATGTPTAGSSVIFGSRDYAHTYIVGNQIKSSSDTVAPILTTDQDLRLNEVVKNNIEITPSKLITNGVREYQTVGAYIANGTSLAYTVPDRVGAVEITAAYRTLAGSTDNQTVTVLFTRNDNDAGRLIEKNTASVGTLNTITYALATGVITFTSANNSASEIIGYEIKEYYGDKI